MSEFYGTLQGNRGPATRQGSKDSGIHAAAQSWEGSVSVRLFRHWEAGDIWCTIRAVDGSHSYPAGRTIYNGPIADLLAGNFLIVHPIEA